MSERETRAVMVQEVTLRGFTCDIVGTDGEQYWVDTEGCDRDPKEGELIVIRRAGHELGSFDDRELWEVVLDEESVAGEGGAA